ncbi:TRAP transporter substrate-binding protein DctP [Betaproteobacteria bacterium LSUCC0117]|nr:TRAP transporter substrate-binding protein DctP [Betaproteobacteria bacterium LSUCC0117]
MIRRTFNIATLALATALAAPAQAQTKLLFNVFLPPTHFLQQPMRDWAADVDKATGGNVKVEFAAGNLAPPPQQLPGVASGIFDIAVTANIFIKSKAPLLEMSQLPWLIYDAEAASVALWRMYGKHFEAKNQFPDVQLLSLFHFAGGHAYSLTDKPINSVDELKSRKMWALPGEAADLLKNLGISPITGPAVKVGEPVSRGVVEGVYGISLDSVVDFKASPYIKAITLFPKAATSTNFSMFINKGKWAALSEKDRAAILSVSGEKLAAAVGRAANEASARSLAKMKASGIQAYNVDPAFYDTLQKAAERSYKEYEGTAAKAGLDGKALVAEFKAQYEALEKK